MKTFSVSLSLSLFLFSSSSQRPMSHLYVGRIFYLVSFSMNFESARYSRNDKEGTKNIFKRIKKEKEGIKTHVKTALCMIIVLFSTLIRRGNEKLRISSVEKQNSIMIIIEVIKRSFCC